MNYTPRRMLPLALYALMLAGCGTPHGVLGTLGTLSPLPNPDQAAEIVVIRPYWYVGSGQGRGIWLDGVLLYGISSDEYVVIQVAPGHHIVGVSDNESKEDATVAVLAEARQRYYFRTGMIESGPDIFPIAAGPAKALIEKSRQVK